MLPQVVWACCWSSCALGCSARSPASSSSLTPAAPVATPARSRPPSARSTPPSTGSAPLLGSGPLREQSPHYRRRKNLDGYCRVRAPDGRRRPAHHQAGPGMGCPGPAVGQPARGFGRRPARWHPEAGRPREGGPPSTPAMAGGVSVLIAASCCRYPRRCHCRCRYPRRCHCRCRRPRRCHCRCRRHCRCHCRCRRRCR
jgi:hypothetical protein